MVPMQSVLWRAGTDDTLAAMAYFHAAVVTVTPCHCSTRTSPEKPDLSGIWSKTINSHSACLGWTTSVGCPTPGPTDRVTLSLSRCRPRD